ncbi:hypothetical protein WA158_001401 [Blastocystis sp. Blastoise]
MLIKELKEKLNEMYNDRLTMENRMNTIIQSLNAPLPSGGIPPGLSGNLIDKDDFPRDDIDIYHIRLLRHELNCLKTDYVEINTKLEQLTKQIFSMQNNNETIHPIAMNETKQIIKSTPEIVLKPIAFIKEIEQGSLSSQSGFEKNDSILQFGNISYLNMTSLQDIIKELNLYLGKQMNVIIERRNPDYTYSKKTLVINVPDLTPIHLGCQIVPL